MKITIENEKNLIRVVDKLEQYADIINSQTDLLRRLPKGSVFWKRIDDVVFKLKSVDGSSMVKNNG